jgi:hypothetical protein
MIWRLPSASISLEEVSTPIPFPCGAGIDDNEQRRSRVGSVRSMQRACPSSIHLPSFPLRLLRAGPLFTRLGSGHRQHRPRIACCDHLYGLGR